MSQNAFIRRRSLLTVTSNSANPSEDAIDSEETESSTEGSGVSMNESPSRYYGYRRFLSRSSLNSDTDGSEKTSSNHDHEVAPLLSGQVLSNVQDFEHSRPPGTSILPQYALVGVRSDHQSKDMTDQELDDNLIFGNTNEPWSAFICGSQGSGKSHTLSCLLENSLLGDSPVGVGPIPSAGMVFHYDKFSNISSGQVCEAAYLCSSGIKVTVLVAPTSLDRMKKQYRNLHGLPKGAPRPKVVPLYFQQAQLTIDTIMSLMAVQDTGLGAPLYINSIRQLLREMALDQQDKPGFNYSDFTTRLAYMQLTDGAMAPLELRLQLLRSVLLAPHQDVATLTTYQEIWNPAPGTLTIVDLSDAFINENDACALFSICLSQFMAGWQQSPRLIALDEAHKFLTTTAEAKGLTSDLIAIVRQQRHLSSRVIVATQEPTVSGEFLDLCNVNIVHRFSSPMWFGTLKQHLAAAHNDDYKQDSLFDKIVNLKVGEAFLFCPRAILSTDENLGMPEFLGNKPLRLLVRQRLSTDGGKSILPSHVISTTDEEEDDDFDGPKVARFANLTLKEIATQAKGQIGTSSRADFVQHVTKAGASKDYSSSSTADEADEKLDIVAGLGRNLEKALKVANSPAQHGSSSSKTRKRTYAADDYIVLTHGKKKISNSEIHRALNVQVRSDIHPSMTRDPSGYFGEIIKGVEKSFKLSENRLKNINVMEKGEPVSVITLLKNIIKQYYDEKGIANKKRAQYKWLLRNQIVITFIRSLILVYWHCEKGAWGA